MANLDIVLSASNMAGAELDGIAKSLERSADALGIMGRPPAGFSTPTDAENDGPVILQGTITTIPWGKVIGWIIAAYELSQFAFGSDNVETALGDIRKSIVDTVQNAGSDGPPSFVTDNLSNPLFSIRTEAIWEKISERQSNPFSIAQFEAFVLQREDNPFSNAQADWLAEREDASGSFINLPPLVNFSSGGSEEGEGASGSFIDLPPLVNFSSGDSEEGDPFTIIPQLDSSEFEAGITSLQGMWDSLIESINQIDTSAGAEALASTVGTVLADMEANVIGIVGGLNSLDGKEIDVDIFIHILGGISGMASGGSVSAGSPYIVGERGFELFVPSQSGQIIPHNESRQMLSGGGSTINIYAPLTIQAANGASLQQILKELA